MLKIETRILAKFQALGYPPQPLFQRRFQPIFRVFLQFVRTPTLDFSRNRRIPPQWHKITLDNGTYVQYNQTNKISPDWILWLLNKNPFIVPAASLRVTRY